MTSLIDVQTHAYIEHAENNISIGHFGAEQGTGSSSKLYLLGKMTPPYKRAL